MSHIKYTRKTKTRETNLFGTVYISFVNDYCSRTSLTFKMICSDQKIRTLTLDKEGIEYLNYVMQMKKHHETQLEKLNDESKNKPVTL